MIIILFIATFFVMVLMNMIIVTVLKMFDNYGFKYGFEIETIQESVIILIGEIIAIFLFWSAHSIVLWIYETGGTY